MQREGFGIRLGAAVIDAIVMIAGGAVLVMAAAFALGAYAAAVLGALFSLAYSSFEVFKGATPGKMLLKLQIRDESGNEATREQLVKRWAVKHGPTMLGLVAAITTLALFNWIGHLGSLAILVGTFMCLKPHRQAWHDTFAKTAVFKPVSAGFQVLPATPAIPVQDAPEPAKQAA